MLENEPFEKLLGPHRPLPKANHYPPILRFGFAISEPYKQFHRAVLKNNLGDQEQLRPGDRFLLLRRLATAYVNERCGLPPEKGVVCQLVRSKQAVLVFEIATNYRTRIPEDELDDVLRVIREVLSLPDDAQPKWYLEPCITDKAPDEYRMPSESSISVSMW